MHTAASRPSRYAEFTATSRRTTDTIVRALFAAILAIIALGLAASSASAQTPASMQSGKVSPVLECVTDNGDGTYTAFFGTNNNTGQVQHHPVGNQNRFHPAPQDRGQVTTFPEGRIYKAFGVTWKGGGNITWILTGKTASAAPGNTCKVGDLSLEKRADRNEAAAGETVAFKITLANAGPDYNQNVQVEDVLPAGLTYVSHAAPKAQGRNGDGYQTTYDPKTGLWDVAHIEPGAALTLVITTTFDGTNAVTNTAEVIRAAKVDRDSEPGNGDPKEDDQDSAFVKMKQVQPSKHIDLALTKTVDDPAPNLGDTVTFTIRVENESAVDATGVQIADTLPAGLTAQGASDGGQISGQTVTWIIGALAANTGVTRTITATVDQAGTFANVAEVTAADQPDSDSAPRNDDGDQSEDDEDSAVVTTQNSSGGGNAGVESDGGMALALAERMFVRRTDAFTKTALRAAPAPVLLTSESAAQSLRSKNASGYDVADLAPQDGPLGSVAYETTPGDLLGITNATSVFAADYLRTDGRRVAALFSTTSQAALYDHTKQTCDRLAGGLLDRVSTLAVATPDGQTRPFVLSTLRQPSGEVDYAVTFVAYRTGSTYTVDSRYVPDSYAVPAGTDEIINVQLWAVTPALTAELAADVLARLADSGTLAYQNDARTAPSVYVRTGRYEQGVLSLDFANASGAAQTVTVAGTVALTEADAQNGDRVAFTRTLDLAANWDDRAGTAFAFDQPIFDAAFTVTAQDGTLVDRAYVADGAWGTNVGDADVQTFEVYDEDRALRTSRRVYDVARDIYVGGTVTDWASAFRFLRAGGQPVDLGQMQYLDLTLSGQGRVQIVIEKASVEGGQQYGTEITLSAQPTSHRIRFDELTRAGGATGFTGEDVTAVVFYVVGDGQRAKRFDLIVQDAQFGGASSVANDRADETAQDALTLGQSYPNPFAGSTVIPFTLPETSEVRLAVYDLLGRTVATLADGTMPSGHHDVRFDAGDLASGTYVYRLETDDQVQTKTLTVLR